MASGANCTATCGTRAKSGANQASSRLSSGPRPAKARSRTHREFTFTAAVIADASRRSMTRQALLSGSGSREQSKFRR